MLLNLSYWAKANKNTARFAIFMLAVLLGLTSTLLGTMLFYDNIHLGNLFPLWAWAMIIAATLAYPLRNVANFHTVRRKFDWALIGATCWLYMAIGNVIPQEVNSFRFLTSNSISVHIWEDIVPLNHLQASVYQPNIKTNALPIPTTHKPLAWKTKIQKFVQFIGKRYKELPTAGKIALYILAVVVAASLGYLLIPLVCGLVCSEMIVLAAVAFFGGLGLLITGLLFSAKALWGGKNLSLGGRFGIFLPIVLLSGVALAGIIGTFAESFMLLGIAIALVLGLGLWTIYHNIDKKWFRTDKKD